MINVLPIDDINEHEENSCCNCNPSVIIENGETIVVHNSFDGREGLEIVNELLNKTL